MSQGFCSLRVWFRHHFFGWLVRRDEAGEPALRFLTADVLNVPGLPSRHTEEITAIEER
jgi:hypothetical protein